MIRKSAKRNRKASLDMRLHELTNEISWLASQNLNLIVNREPDINDYNNMRLFKYLNSYFCIAKIK